MNDLLFRPAGIADAAAIARLEMAAFPSPWKQEFFESELRAAGRLNLVVEDSSHTLVGYLFTMYFLDELHVNKIAVREDMRRKGLAGQLMDVCFEFARKHGLHRISLEVRESNTAARHFYERLHFTETYRRVRYYPDGETAVVMTRESGPGEWRS